MQKLLDGHETAVGTLEPALSTNTGECQPVADAMAGDGIAISPTSDIRTMPTPLRTCFAEI